MMAAVHERVARPHPAKLALPPVLSEQHALSRADTGLNSVESLLDWDLGSPSWEGAECSVLGASATLEPDGDASSPIALPLVSPAGADASPRPSAPADRRDADAASRAGQSAWRPNRRSTLGALDPVEIHTAAAAARVRLSSAEAAAHAAQSRLEALAGIAAAIRLHVAHGQAVARAQRRDGTRTASRATSLSSMSDAAAARRAASEARGAFAAGGGGALARDPAAMAAAEAWWVQHVRVLEERRAPAQPAETTDDDDSLRRGGSSSDASSASRRYCERECVALLELLLDRLSLEVEVAVFAFALLERALCVKHLLSRRNWRPALLAAFVLAAKHWCDGDVWLADVRARLAPELDCTQLARAELALANLLQFELGVPSKLFFKYLYALRDLGRQALSLDESSAALGARREGGGRSTRHPRSTHAEAMAADAAWRPRRWSM